MRGSQVRAVFLGVQHDRGEGEEVRTVVGERLAVVRVVLLGEQREEPVNDLALPRHAERHHQLPQCHVELLAGEVEERPRAGRRSTPTGSSSISSALLRLPEKELNQSTHLPLLPPSYSFAFAFDQCHNHQCPCLLVRRH